MTNDTNFPPLPFVIGRVSDAGRSGKNNEDSADDFRAQLTTQQNGNSLTVPIQVAVVADGIGGNVAGETASRMAVDTIREYFRGHELMAVSARLVAAIEEANQRIYERAVADPALGGMGTTIVAAAIEESRLYVAHAGDSRAYLLRNGRLYRLTLDHTWAQEAIEAGRLKPAEAKDHPNRHVIKRFLGISDVVDVDSAIVDISHSSLDPEQIHTWPRVDVLTLQPGDRLILCSDGLTDVVEDGKIAELAARYSPQESAQKLVDQANKAGGPDNITVVVVYWADGSQPVAATVAKRSPAMAIGLGLAAIAVVAAIYFLLTGALNQDALPTEATPVAETMGDGDGEPANSATLVSENNGAAPADAATPTEPATATSTATDPPTQTATETPTDLPEATPTPAPPTSTPVDGAPSESAVEDPPTDTTTITGTPASTIDALGENAATSISAIDVEPNGTPTPDAGTPSALLSGRTAATITGTAVTSTPVPDFSPTPTVTATPLPSETPTPVPLPSRAIGATATSVVAPTTGGTDSVEFANASVTLMEPADGDTLNSIRTFQWQSSFTLPDGYYFEPIFWQTGEAPIVAGRGYGGTTTAQSIKIDPEVFRKNGAKPGDYLWGVLIVQLSPSYERIKFLNASQRIRVEFSSGNNGEGGAAGSRPD